MNTEELQQRKAELEHRLTRAEVFSDFQKVREISIELGKIEKELQAEVSSAGKNTGGMEHILLEIRAGAGGDEAALFAGELVHMYTNYARERGWTAVEIDSHSTALGGYRSRTGSFVPRNTVPWCCAGRNPLDQFDAAPFGSPRPSGSTT
mgnify:CR=1 FL=1